MQRPIQKDGTIYEGTISKRRIMIKRLSAKEVLLPVYETADGRWFDRGGLPIDKSHN